jgi:choline-sulfatase
MAGEHGMWWKLSFYEGAIGVPLIWSFPAQFAAGQVAPAFASLLDVGPTLLDLAGAAALPNATGRSLRPWLEGMAPEDWPQRLEAEMVPGLGVPPARLIRRGPWKLTFFDGDDRPQLFNLDADPQEFVDRAGDPARAGVRDTLLAEARAGWSGDAIEATLARRAADRHLLTAYARAVELPDPDYWPAPPGSNVFPE